MKTNKLKTYLKLGILSFGITLLTTNCEKDDNLETEAPQLKSHSLNEMPLTVFLNSSTYQTFKETVPNKDGNNLSYRNINPNSDYEFNSSKVLTTNLNGEKTYNSAIRKTDGSDQDYNLNLMIKENSLDTRTYIVKHAKDGSNIIIQSVNFSPNIPTTPDGYQCAGVGWSATTPCPCQGHTSISSCSCSTPPTHTSGTITVCWDEPIYTEPPIFGGGGTHNPIGGNAGGPGEPIKHTQPPKIYIYEGEEQCFSNGECTPPLYWAQVVAENDIDSFNDIVIVDSPDNPITDLTGFFECFDVTQDAVVTVYASEPDPGTGEAWEMTWDGPFVGHTFISISQASNTSVFGFYPQGDEVGLSNPNDTSSLGEDGGDPFSASISTTITGSQLQQIIDFSINFNSNYDLNTYNCTDFAIEAGNIGGLNLPSSDGNWPGGGGSNPGTLGEHIRSLNPPSNSNISINTSTGNAPTTYKGC